MAGGSKKKKKPATNPARGFATTSIQSVKSKVEEAVDVSDSNIATSTHPESNSTTTTKINQVQSSGGNADTNGTSKDLHELNPEEFEAQLETSELQQVVQQYASKVRKDSTRQITRFETDKRLLRGQADYLAVKEWLPDELLQEVLAITQSEWTQENDLAKKPAIPLGDQFVAKLWSLRLCLRDLDVPADRIDQVLAHLIKCPPQLDSSSLIWGLATAFDWLALNCAEIPAYDFQKVKSLEAIEANHDGGSQDNETVQPAASSSAPDSQALSNLPNADVVPIEDDFEVSDLESDIDPDELLAIYLRTKTNLFQLNPAAMDGFPTKKMSARAKASTSSNTIRPTIGMRKLADKLSQIESDILFDKSEADAQWAVKRIELSRDAADRRRYQLADPPTESVNAEAERITRELLEESADQESDDLLGGMFDALPGVAEHVNGSASNQDTQAIVIRDFGRMTGLNPKRILEETSKSRDSQVKISYRLASPTTYASRHAITVQWSKHQDLAQNFFLQTVGVVSKPHTTTITSKTVATPDVAQSEAYIATIALFFIFSGSAKEEKAHMRLPPSYRDLWDELTALQQEDFDTHDRDTIKQLRELVVLHQTPDEVDGDDEEVVFNVNSRRRIGGSSGIATPLSQRGIELSGAPPISEDIQAMWARKTSLPSYQRMLETRMRLPMYQFKSSALEIIQKHQVTILCGETGCGKSTQLPAFILEQELSHGRRCKIYCTEPRRISAVSLAQRVSEELGERPGDVGTARSLVGYAIRLESHTAAETMLIYATVGIVLRMLERPDGMSDVTHLVIDEVHERSIDTDFLLIVLRSLMLKRPELKVVLMSATVDAQKFSNYLDGAPIITVPGRTFPVQAKFLEDAIELTGHSSDAPVNAGIAEQDEDFDVDTASKGVVKLSDAYSKLTRSTMSTYDEYQVDYSLIVKILEKVASDAALQRFSKATLIFLPGIGEIRQLNDILTSTSTFARDWKIYPLHSSFSSDDQQAAFQIPPPGVRKIVLATNIAETGITIPDVTCVIDTGKHKEMRFDERRQISKLVLSFIAKANAKQRRGRAGRVQEGICFHLFTKHRHDELMAEQQTPEMLRLSLQDLAMRVKICKLGDIEHALSQALDPPSAKNIRRAIDALVEVDALTPSEELTPLGSQIARLPLDAQLGKFVLLSCAFGCLDLGVTIAAALTSKSPFLTPMHARNKADTVRLGFKRGDSDLLTLYNAYCAWRKVCLTHGSSEHQFCNKNFLSWQNLANIEDLKAQLVTSLVDSGFVVLDAAERSALSRIRPGSRQRDFVTLPAAYTRAENDDTIASAVLAWSFYPKIVKQDGKGWRNIANNQSLGLHPTSVNKHSLPAQVKLLSFYSIMQSNSRFTNAQETTPVPDMALVLLAGDAVFHMHAGVVVIDGNRLRYKVADWRVMIALKTLRMRLKEAISRYLRYPGRELTGRHKLWLDMVGNMFTVQGRVRAA